ncbi:unnamed protein product [Rotaria sordida]|uniref:Cytochrome P450 n=1 Tax=Rotaria sordida TaxID=392033 RepID=A0A819C3M1_9BILA|nr:unnamed protein product [Rotaria sordida]CAF3814104.1 unnamed protein product [Rotaria sordida]
MLYFLLNAFVVFLLIGLFIIYWKLIRTAKRIYDALHNQHVPGKPFVPIIGQLSELYQAHKNDTIIDFMTNIVQKYGYYFLVGFGPLTRLFIIEPKLIGDILHRSHEQDYIKPADFVTIFEPFIGKHNLLVSEGAEHDRARKMINPAFYFNNLKAMISIMVEQTNKSIDELLPNFNNQQTVDLQKEFSALTLSIIVSGAFGKQLENQGDLKAIVCESIPKVAAAIEYRTMRMINQVPLLAKLPICQKHIIDQCSQDIARIVDQIIADRREGRSSSLSSSNDLLDLLLSAVDSEGIPFNDQEIKEHALTFVFAGHETTGSLMIWISYILMTNNNVLRACQEEVDRILSNGTQITYEHLTELNVCEAVIQETLRLYPSAPFLSRECIHEHTIGNENDRQLLIPVDTTIIIDIYQLHRRAEFWHRPLEFDYTRWLRDPITGLKPKLSHPFCYLPFGAGPRNCIGQNFAMLEAKVILASFIQRCNFELEPGQKIIPDIMVNMRSKYGLRAKISRR